MQNPLLQNYRDLRHLVWSNVQYRVRRDLQRPLIDLVYNKVTLEKATHGINRMTDTLYIAIGQQIFKLLDHIE